MNNNTHNQTTVKAKSLQKPLRHIAIVGAGMAGVSCAKALVQAGHCVTLFEKSRGVSGRMSTRKTEFGGFDHGAQYFTVRDKRFSQALKKNEDLIKAWSASGVRHVDEHGLLLMTAPAPTDSHFVATPSMNSLLKNWVDHLGSLAKVETNTEILSIEPDTIREQSWQLRAKMPDGSQHIFAGFDSVLLAIPCPQTMNLLKHSSVFAIDMMAQLSEVKMAPCWTLMVALPQSITPSHGAAPIGPHWNVARSSSNRIAWLARESSKPGHQGIDRWVAHASPSWSTEHLEDHPLRVQEKMLKAFSDITNIKTGTGHATVHRWRYAQTTHALGKSHIWDGDLQIGICGDWCLGHRVENAFVSGLELALACM